MKKIILSLIVSLGFVQLHAQENAPVPYGALPSSRQLLWQEMEMYAIVHFTPTTFQNKEWGYGDANPAIFNPKNFNADQIVSALKKGGFKGLTVVAKHHDGFCLWPTKTTTYNISASPFREGKGDLVGEFAAACRKAGLQLGLYCSPWDRNNVLYGKPEYVTTVFYPQLKELYSNYGPLFTVFFDGANGGDGYFGGAEEKRTIDASTYYNFDEIWKLVREKQPKANIFSDVGPDIRWVGNEKGAAAVTSWATITPLPTKTGTLPSPGNANSEVLQTGTRDGKYWIPAECDVPLRKGWFYHPEHDGQSRTAQQLLDIYYSSVGRGACLDLGISPTPDGILSKEDENILEDFGKLVHQTFADNLAKKASLQVSNTRNANFSARNLIDNDRYSYWATADNITTPQAIFTFKNPIRFNVIRLRENIKLGQRISRAAIDIWQNNRWEEVAVCTSIGGNRLMRLPQYLTAKKVRLRILEAPVCIALSDFGLFAEPESVVGQNKSKSEFLADATAKTNWKGLLGNEKTAIDNDHNTVWVAPKDKPKELSIDFGTMKQINAFTYLPPQKGRQGIADQYIFYTSADGKNWNEAASGEFSNIVNNPVLQTVYTKKPVTTRYIRMIAKRLVQGERLYVAEIGVIEK